MGGGARPGARNRAGARSRPRARDPDRRVRPRGGRGPPPAGPARRHGAREACPPPRHRSCRRGAWQRSQERQRHRHRHRGRRARAGRRGRPGFDLGVRGRRRDAPAIALAGTPGAAPRGNTGAGPARRPPSPDPRAHRGGGSSRGRRDAGIARSLDAPSAVPGGDLRASGAGMDGRRARGSARGAAGAGRPGEGRWRRGRGGRGRQAGIRPLGDGPGDAGRLSPAIVGRQGRTGSGPQSRPLVRRTRPAPG